MRLGRAGANDKPEVPNDDEVGDGTDDKPVAEIAGEAAEGMEIKAGALLYQIDDREFKADLKAARAELEIALAQREKATHDLARAKVLKEKGSISTEEFERNDTAMKQAAASVLAAEAKRDRAKLNVEFSHIAAPISGKISKTEITAGNLIRADNTLLTTIVSQDPIDVYFDMDERTLLKVRRLMLEGKVKGVKLKDGDDKETFPVEMGLAIDEGYPKQGYIDFLDNRVNPATGTIRVRGIFKNPELQSQRREMSPGMFCRVRVPLSQPHPALLIAERAIGTDQGRKYVYVINEKDEVVDRTIVLGPIQEGLRVVTSGLKPDDKLIIDGMQRVRPGVEVAPKPARMDSRPGDAEKDADKAPADSDGDVSHKSLGKSSSGIADTLA